MRERNTGYIIGENGTFPSEIKDSKVKGIVSVRDILKTLKPYETIEIRRVERIRCQGIAKGMRGEQCGTYFWNTRKNRQYCSPWCQNRVSTWKSRHKNEK